MRPPKTFSGSRRAGFFRLCAIAFAQAGLAASAAFVVRDLIDAVSAGSGAPASAWPPVWAGDARPKFKFTSFTV